MDESLSYLELTGVSPQAEYAAQNSLYVHHPHQPALTRLWCYGLLQHAFPLGSSYAAAVHFRGRSCSLQGSTASRLGCDRCQSHVLMRKDSQACSLPCFSRALPLCHELHRAMANSVLHVEVGTFCNMRLPRGLCTPLPIRSNPVLLPSIVRLGSLGNCSRYVGPLKDKTPSSKNL